MECRRRGGLLELIGFSELVHPSNPPAKYLKCTFSGTIAGTVFSNGTCSSPTGASFTVAYTGAAEYDPATGLLISSGQETVIESPGGTTILPLPAPVIFVTDCYGDAVTDQISSRKDDGQTGACCPTGVNLWQKHTGPTESRLSKEDTEEKAIARLSDDAWSEWTVVGPSCINPGCCLSVWQERIEGFFFLYTEAEFRVRRGGLVPSTDYTIKVFLYRRPWASGTYVLFKTLIFQATADPAGDIELTGEIPNERGFETYAARACILIPTYELTTTVAGEGSVIPSGTTKYSSGNEVTLNPTPSAGWEFAGWSGDLSGNANPGTLLMDGDKHVVATFTEI